MRAVRECEVDSFRHRSSADTYSTHNAVPLYSLFSDDAMEALIDEGARLVTGYLVD